MVVNWLCAPCLRSAGEMIISTLECYMAHNGDISGNTPHHGQSILRALETSKIGANWYVDRCSSRETMKGGVQLGCGASEFLDKIVCANHGTLRNEV